MNLVIVCSVIPPSRIPNGIGEYSLQMARALAAEGHSVSVICSSADIDRELTQSDFPREPNLKFFPFRPVGKPGLGISSRLAVIPQELLSQSDAVIINSMLQGASVLAAFQCQLARKPYVLVPHGALLPAALQQSALKKSVYLSLLGRRLIRSAAALLATSSTEAEAMSPFSGNVPIQVLPSGASQPEPATPGEVEDLERSWPELKGREVVACLSRVSREKGLDLLLDGWPRVVQKHPLALLAVAVNGDARELREQAKKLRVSDSVLFLEKFSGPGKWRLFRRAEVIVVPSRSESFGLVVVEALACGKPVVATHGTPWSTLKERDCGRWVEVDSRAIGEAMTELLNLSQRDREAMGQRGIELVQDQYSWPKIARRVGEFLIGLKKYG